MVALAVGAIILVPFPFSDLSQAKLRPAVDVFQRVVEAVIVILRASIAK
jgi:hypothetical protein